MTIRYVFAALTISFGSLSFAATSFVLQAGAHKDQGEAIEAAVMLEDAGYLPVTVRPEESATKGLFYKVLVGDFPKRADADTAKKALADRGINSFVRSAENFDLSAVRAAILGSNEETYFADKVIHVDSSPTTLSAEAQKQRTEVLGTDTTSPEALKSYTEFIQNLPDNTTAKGREIIRLGHYSSFGRSVYKGETAAFVEADGLLRLVANGQINATAADKLAAREMVAHGLHYYTRSYSEALVAYRQILRQELKKNNWAAVAKARVEIAATSYELAKSSGFDRSVLQELIAALWNDAVAMQEPFVREGLTSSAETEANQIRSNTARIGLMLTEILMEQKRWEEAKQVASELVSMYSEFPICDGERAESYCHLSKIGLRLKDKELCYSSFEHAIRLAEKAGKIWGDENRDPLWKAYALKNAASYHFDEPLEVREAIKQEMLRKFPGHPGLSTYFGGKDK